jgi:hypothetical protein
MSIVEWAAVAMVGYPRCVARLLRFAWPALTAVWLVAIAAADAGSGVGGSVVLPAMILPAVLLGAAAALAVVSTVDIPGVAPAAARISMARHARAVAVLRACDPDAPGRIRPRAPGA